MSDITSRQRNSSIELLRLVAMLMIVIGHTTSTVGGIADSIILSDYTIDLRNNTTEIWRFILILFEYFGSIGNAIFIVISSWFLTNSKKINYIKIVRMIVDVSIFSGIIMFMFILCGYKLPLVYMIKTMFSVTLSNYWFITCYILIYIIHPWINYIINSMTQRTLLKTVLILNVFYGIINFIFWHALEYSRLIGFLMIYFTVAYVKKYMKNHSSCFRWNMACLCSSIVGFFCLMVITNILGYSVSFCRNKMLHWTQFICPFFVAMGIASMNILTKIKCRFNKIINLCSSTIIYIYLIHENLLIRTYFRPQLFQYLYEKYGHNLIVLQVFTVAFLLYTFSMLIGLLYNFFIKDKLYSLIDVICSSGEKIFNDLINKLQMIN